MIIPIRCFTCGGLVADKWLRYEEATKNMKNKNDKEEMKYLFEELGLKKHCCRRMLLSNSNVIDQIIQYHENLYDKNKRMEFDFS